MNELLSTLLSQGVLGQAIKHVIPWDGINRLIPVINVVEGVAVNKVVHNLDWGSSVVYGVVGALAAKGAKDGAKNTFQSLQQPVFPGLAVRDRKLVVTKRSL